MFVWVVMGCCSWVICFVNFVGWVLLFGFDGIGVAVVVCVCLLGCDLFSCWVLYFDCFVRIYLVFCLISLV